MRRYFYVGFGDNTRFIILGGFEDYESAKAFRDELAAVIAKWRIPTNLVVMELRDYK